MARSTSKEALSLIKGSTDSAVKLRALIYQLDKGLQISITEKEIGDHISAQFRKSVAKRAGKASTADRKQLSKARVITTEEVLRLKEAREAADAEKAVKALARELKKKLKESQGSPAPKTRGRGKKKVTISEDITVHIIDSDSEEEESVGPASRVGIGVDDEAEEEWASIDDFPDSPPLSTTIRASRRRGGYKGVY
jgi:ClpP class serine protease